MKVFTRLGFIMVGGAFLIFIFQGISALMEKNYRWVDITLSDVTNGFLDPFIDKIPVYMIADGVRYTVNQLPLYLLLLIVALVFIILGSFAKK